MQSICKPNAMRIWNEYDGIIWENMRELKYFLGLQLRQEDERIYSKQKYIKTSS